MAPVRTSGVVDSEGGWQLEGHDGAGRPVRLWIGETQLAHTYLGVTVGRHAALCEVVIDDPSVSRRHFRIGRGSAGLYAEDVRSLNGTDLDGAPLQPFAPVALADGQTLTLGRVTLTVARRVDRLAI